MKVILDHYGLILQEVDDWFASCLGKFPGRISCRYGCAECCRGLFDITLLDALYLKRGFDLLPESVKQRVAQLSEKRLRELSSAWPEFVPPWTLNHLSEDQWDEMMPEDDPIPCPFLSEEGICLTYSHRPMTCRLNGIPLINPDGEEFFDEWCTLNFVGVDPLVLEGLRFPFRDLFSRELQLFRKLSEEIFGVAVNEMDTIIPAVPFLDEGMLSRLELPAQG